ncbi:hypothetical protein [Streptomyces colonosanans]|uniref:Uncharacterized protein n=1 Tax=Streptomyces colonosanans TaxID=1428652 RepID=A0A1S2P7F4_9ACTN|nr:hypothetical protein [Streptomyces colonosanans]OIJ89769.1 hypothetical protein BIV24_19320 [Streptomyces colonosanans]
MRAFVGNQEAVSKAEFAELAQGFDDPRDLPSDFLPTLFLGVLGESDEEGRARQAAAKDILAELIEISRSEESRGGDEPSIDGMNAAYAMQLAAVTSLPSRFRGRDGRTSKAA